MTADRLLVFLLRANGAILLCAAPCALLPFSWMEAIHRDFLGLGPLHAVPLTRYLTRSLSLMYAMHGTVVMAVTLDWARYRPFAPVIAWLHISFGCAMLAVDLDAGLPWWWTAGEGPTVVLYGIAVLVLYRRASRDEPGVSGVGGEPRRSHPPAPPQTLQTPPAGPRSTSGEESHRKDQP